MTDDTKGTAPPTALAATQVRVAIPPPSRESSPALAAVQAARYHEHGVLGRGGMGEVHVVEDSLIGREIAVKTIASKLVGTPGMRERFLREVRIQGQLEHPAIVPVYDAGVDARGNDYFTMKRIAGRTLAAILNSLAGADAATVKTYPRNGLLAIFRQVCLAMAYAHSRGVMHRDLKPANIMVGDFGEVYVLDWGIARLAVEDTLPHDDEILGTPGYMSPEQIRDATQVDERTDVYALGAILFEILALDRLHKASTAAEALAITLDAEAARPALRAPHRDIPPELDDLCSRATAPDPVERIQTARELADAIERYLEGDRDLERRRDLARHHAAAAGAARDRVKTGTPSEADAARREALREAGRALALDPDAREGLRAAVELMLEPPREIPAEVHREIERTQADRVRAGLLPGIVVFGLFAIAALVIPLLAGPVNWIPPLVVAGSLAVGVATSASLLRSKRLHAEVAATFVIVASVSVAIAFTSFYAGAMMLIPPLTVALANALAATQLRWRAYLVLCIAGFAIPFAAEWAGISPRSYAFLPEGLLVRPVVMQLSETVLRFTVLVTTIGVMVGSVLYVRRVTLVETELRERWLLHNWHLRQMAQMTELMA